MQGEQLFGSDLSLGLTEDDNSDSESLAIREYFRHRGAQGHLLEEDSLRLGSGSHTLATNTGVDQDRVAARSPSRSPQAVPRVVGGSAFAPAGSSVSSSLRAYDDNSSWVSGNSSSAR